MTKTESQQPKLTVETLSNLGLERLAQFILYHAARNPTLREFAERMLVNSQNPSRVYQEIIERIKGICSGPQYYYRSAASHLDHEIDDIVRSITDELVLISTGDAVLALQYLVEHDKDIIEKVDTSDGVVYPQLQHAVTLLGGYWARIPEICAENIAAYVHDRLCNNEYSVFDGIIGKFSAALGDVGMRHLEKLLRAELTQCSSDNKRHSKIRHLKEIADAQSDVDKYITLCREFESPLSDYSTTQCAKRLANVERAPEALLLLEQVKRDSPALQPDIEATLIRCYEIQGRAQDVQAILERRFHTYPSIDTLDALLECTGATDDNRQRYISSALASEASEYTLMDFLVELKDYEPLAALIRTHMTTWDGERYYSLAPAALALEDAYPFEASVLYRALVNSVLQRAQARYYHHAARYLVRLQALMPRIEDFKPFCSHAEYIASMRDTHKRKTSLWAAIKHLQVDAKDE